MQRVVVRKSLSTFVWCGVTSHLKVRKFQKDIMVSKILSKSNENKSLISALASKKCLNQYILIIQIGNTEFILFFDLTNLLDARAENREIFCVELLGELKTPQFLSEISWPIARLMALALIFYIRGTLCIVYNLVFTHFHSAVSTPTPIVSSSGLSEPAPLWLQCLSAPNIYCVGYDIDSLHAHVFQVRYDGDPHSRNLIIFWNHLFIVLVFWSRVRKWSFLIVIT